MTVESCSLLQNDRNYALEQFLRREHSEGERQHWQCDHNQKSNNCVLAERHKLNFFDNPKAIIQIRQGLNITRSQERLAFFVRIACPLPNEINHVAACESPIGSQ